MYEHGNNLDEITMQSNLTYFCFRMTDCLIKMTDKEVHSYKQKV